MGEKGRTGDEIYKGVFENCKDMLEGKEGIIRIDDREFYKRVRNISSRAKVICDTLSYIYFNVLPYSIQKAVYKGIHEGLFELNKKFPSNEEWKVKVDGYFRTIYLYKGHTGYFLCDTDWKIEAVDSYWREKLEFLENAIGEIFSRFLLTLSLRHGVKIGIHTVFLKLGQELLKQKTAQNETEEQKKKLEEEISQLQNVMKKATYDLFNTKGICKSKRIAEIRENLEKALGGRFLNGRFVKYSELSKAAEDAIFDECHLY